MNAWRMSRTLVLHADSLPGRIYSGTLKAHVKLMRVGSLTAGGGSILPKRDKHNGDVTQLTGDQVQLYQRCGLTALLCPHALSGYFPVV